MYVEYSVIIPVFNCAHLLEKTVASVAEQSLDADRYEILIIDDGSTDQSLDVAQGLAARHGNIRLLSNEVNLGLGATRNRGILEALGEYISFVDSDDLLRSDALELFARQIDDQHDPDVVYADILRMNAYGDVEKRIPRARFNNFKFRSLSRINTCIAPGAVFKRSFLLENGIRFSEGYFHEDVVFSVHCLLSAPSVKAIPHNLYYYISRDGSILRSFNPKSVESVVYTLEAIYRLLDEKGLLPQDMKGWKAFARNMISNLYVQIINFTRPPHQEVQMAEAMLRQSSLLARHNILEHSAFQSRRTPKTVPQDIKKSLFAAASGAVVMIAEADYHVRNFVTITRALQRKGIKTIICDLSPSQCFTFKRVMPDEERESYADVPIFQFDGKNIPPVFVLARAYLFSIDWGHFKPVLLEARRRGIPTFAFYEGISDDFLSEPASRGKLFPYRNVDALLVPGAYYRSIYGKQQVHVTGLPIIRDLLKVPVAFPARLQAVINVNFTYNVLEDKRDLFVGSAMKACKVCGVEPVLSQHPADKGEYGPTLVSAGTIYDCLKSSSMLISRFSTCILEALALGKPTIYYNPHGERFPKFQADPMGAYKIANNPTELVLAIRETVLEIHRGIDFREKSRDFLAYHANAYESTPPEELAASALCAALLADRTNYEQRLLYHAGKPYTESTPVRFKANSL